MDESGASKVPFLDLRSQIDAQRQDLESAVASVLDSGWFILGREVESFEGAFARWCGASNCVGVNSGTDAITLALQAVGVSQRDEVIVPANTCVPTIAGVIATGAVPVLADVDDATATLDPASAEAAVTDRTRAIVPVHLYGQTADMRPILDIARRTGLRVVEDAAQAHGASYHGARAGTLGDAAAFSFYPTKNLGAFGDAGAVVTNDAGVAAAARNGRNYGYRERDLADMRGRNSRLDEIQAAILSAKLTRLDEANERRRRLAQLYLERLEGAPVCRPEVGSGRTHCWHLFVVRVKDRQALREKLLAKGVQTQVHYPRPIHHQPAYCDLPRVPDLGVSEAWCEEALSLPLYPELSESAVDAVASALRAALG